MKRIRSWVRAASGVVLVWCESVRSAIRFERTLRKLRRAMRKVGADGSDVDAQTECDSLLERVRADGYEAGATQLMMNIERKLVKMSSGKTITVPKGYQYDGETGIPQMSRQHEYRVDHSDDCECQCCTESKGRDA